MSRLSRKHLSIFAVANIIISNAFRTTLLLIRKSNVHGAIAPPRERQKLRQQLYPYLCLCCAFSPFHRQIFLCTVCSFLRYLHDGYVLWCRRDIKRSLLCTSALHKAFLRIYQIVGSNVTQLESALSRWREYFSAVTEPEASTKLGREW